MEEQRTERPLVIICHVATTVRYGGVLTKHHSDMRLVYITDPFRNVAEMVADNEHGNEYVS